MKAITDTFAAGTPGALVAGDPTGYAGLVMKSVRVPSNHAVVVADGGDAGAPNFYHLRRRRLPGGSWETLAAHVRPNRGYKLALEPTVDAYELGVQAFWIAGWQVRPMAHADFRPTGPLSASIVFDDSGGDMDFNDLIVTFSASPHPKLPD